MTIEGLGSTVYLSCSGPTCFVQDPHAHQHWVYWPDDDESRPAQREAEQGGEVGR